MTRTTDQYEPEYDPITDMLDREDASPMSEPIDSESTEQSADDVIFDIHSAANHWVRFVREQSTQLFELGEQITALRAALDQERKAKPLRIWIDAEWNSYKGALISFACVSEDDRMFYQEVVLHEVPDPWIVENVLPHLSGWTTTTRRSAAVEYEVFQQRLREYIDGFDGPIEFISDWPEDIEQLCRALIVGPGRSSVYRPITFRCGMGEFKGAVSAVPHHALHDARSLRDFALLSGRGEAS